MLQALEDLTPVGEELSRRARGSGVQLIWRAQSRTVRRAVVREGRTEGVSVASVAGHGVQVVTPEGRTALASRDDLEPDRAVELFERVLAIAGRGERLGLDAMAFERWAPLRARAIPGRPEAFATVNLQDVARRLVDLEREIKARVDGVRLQLGFRSELDAWRVFRADGTDVMFAMPRCTLSMRATASADGAAHGVSAVVFSPDPALPWDDARVDLFLRRAEGAARLALELPQAPSHPAGSFPVVIDYALAKGLAHEAFGHAAEADGFRSSVLARDGRFRCGERVGGDQVSIIDEPIADDHAWQPFSANGLPRERATIVDHGRLTDALSDPWSAGPGGVRMTGAARAESFHGPPLPRMTNIRIEVDAPLPAPGEFEDYGPGEVRDLLAGSGVLARHPQVIYLSGYTGGQVNTASGDFVFNCKAIYVLSRDRITLHKPAIFSGSMFGALESLREAFGPLRLDALGYCGKWGQSVPSSGGSHYFLVLEPHDSVRLGALSVSLETLLDLLRSGHPADRNLRHWAVHASEGRRLTLGVKDGEAGNAHAPLRLAESCGASYLLVWDDGRISRGSLERRQLEGDLAGALELAREAAYEDPDAAHVLAPGDVPDVALHAPAAAALAGGDTTLLEERLPAIREAIAASDVRTWSGSFSAGEGSSRLLNSAGIDYRGTGTTVSWWVTVDGEIGDGHASRGPDAADAFARRLTRLLQTAAALRRPAEPLAGAVRPVLLHPRVVEEYVLDTLLENLRGSSVAHGDGHFRREDFGADRNVLREDLHLRLDPLQPMRRGSYRFTSEGLPAARCSYVESGRLLRPLLDVKYARRLDMEPTPLPFGSDAIDFGGAETLEYDAALALADVLVLSVLGVHTQDSSSGDFSLAAPQTLRLLDGRPAGRLRATISGNLFAVLNDRALRFVRFEDETSPGLLFPCRLDPQ